MSELTLCNYCIYKRMSENAAERDAVVILEPEPDPLSTDNPWIAARYSDQTEPSAWFMELTDRCVC